MLNLTQLPFFIATHTDVQVHWDAPEPFRHLVTPKRLNKLLRSADTMTCGRPQPTSPGAGRRVDDNVVRG